MLTFLRVELEDEVFTTAVLLTGKQPEAMGKFKTGLGACYVTSADVKARV
jgi:hypothetical protein